MVGRDEVISRGDASVAMQKMNVDTARFQEAAESGALGLKCSKYSGCFCYSEAKCVHTSTPSPGINHKGKECTE